MNPLGKKPTAAEAWIRSGRKYVRVPDGGDGPQDWTVRVVQPARGEGLPFYAQVIIEWRGEPAAKMWDAFDRRSVALARRIVAALNNAGVTKRKKKR